ncbi:mitochondrial inner membrane protease ATP23 homolog [Halyomorpha halys]|uniref:mitochondrial inner membrane protease ATP23 homolog n=1 Tax=Halyomorpha halys TaxID=286706 RepID=UPI0034D3672D
MNEAKNEESQPNASDESANYGYNLFPERKGELSRTVTGILTGKEGKEEIQRMKCERTVYKCFMTSSLVKLMTGALKASGWFVAYSYLILLYLDLIDIVICQNNSRSEGVVQGIMTHEMIHMFDYCNNKVDFKNLDHLACTEIRAANLTHCSLTSSVLQGDVSPFNIKANHKECVKRKALASIMAVRNVSLEEAVAAVERVFPKCYNDLEPIGRRIKGGGDDQKRAYAEGFLYGYV